MVEASPDNHACNKLAVFSFGFSEPETYAFRSDEPDWHDFVHQDMICMAPCFHGNLAQASYAGEVACVEDEEKRIGIQKVRVRSPALLCFLETEHVPACVFMVEAEAKFGIASLVNPTAHANMARANLHCI
jgi:hypothetical protein